MKKILGILLAIALVGGAFAQAAAPAADATAKAPALTVTSGLTGSMGFNAIKEDTVSTLDGTFASTSVSVSQNSAASLQVEPWVNFDLGNGLGFKYTQGYQVGINYAGSDATLSRFDTTYKNGGLTIYNTTYWDKGDYYNLVGGDYAARPFVWENGFKFASDNVSGELRLREAGTSAGGVGYNWPGSSSFADLFFHEMNNGILRQAVFTIKDIADVATLQVGDRLNYHYIRMMGIGGNDFTSTSEVGRLDGQGISGGSPINVDTTFDFNKTLQLPLTFKWWSYVPTASTILPDYLAGGNTFFDVGYSLKDVGSFDAGYGLAMDYTTNVVTGNDGKAGTPTTYTVLGKGMNNGLLTAVLESLYNLTNAPAYPDPWQKALLSKAGNSKFWLDANLSLVPNLALQVGFDGSMGSYADASTLAVTNVSTLYTVTKLDPVAYGSYNLGVEASYDLKDSVKGLSVAANLYYGMVTGADYKKESNVAFSSTSTASDFYAASYTDASASAFALGLLPGAQVDVSAKYAFNDMLSFSVSNKFNTAAGDFQKQWNNIDTSSATYTGDLLNWASLGGKNAHGFYGSDAVSLGTSYVAGKGTLGLTVTYTMYTGLPTASDLTPTGLTAAQEAGIKAAYDAFVSSKFNPWSAALSYTVSF